MQRAILALINLIWGPSGYGWDPREGEARKGERKGQREERTKEMKGSRKEKGKS